MVYELEKEHKKSSLMCKKKEELVKEIMRLEHNVNVMNERLNNQANAIKHYEQESRNKAIEELTEEAMKQFTKLELKDSLATATDFKIILRDVAERVKGGVE